MGDLNGLFSGWEIDEFYATHPEKGYRVWIGVAPSFFKDADRDQAPFLAGVSWWMRRRLWRELKRERRRRAENRIKELVA